MVRCCCRMVGRGMNGLEVAVGDHVVSCWFLVMVGAFGWPVGAGYGIRRLFGEH